jgi:hypothetical protein
LPEGKRQFTKPSQQPVRLDVRKFLAVYAGRALIGAALRIGMRQDVFAARYPLCRAPHNGYSALFIVPLSRPAPLTANFYQINEIARVKSSPNCA